MSDVVSWARGLAASVLAATLPRRWKHVQAAAARAENLRLVLGAEADFAVSAAWLHDVGYAPTAAATGFHHLDGARFLRQHGACDRLCGLVASHSGGRWEAPLRGLAAELAEFPDECSLVSDVLWYCDMTTSPIGEPVTFDERLVEVRQRYGEQHSVPRSLAAAEGEIRAALTRVLRQARSFGVTVG